MIGPRDANPLVSPAIHRGVKATSDDLKPFQWFLAGFFVQRKTVETVPETLFIPDPAMNRGADEIMRLSHTLS